MLGSVQNVADGHDVWESANTQDLQDYAKEKLMPLASSTHRIEAWWGNVPIAQQPTGVKLSKAITFSSGQS